MKLLSKQYHPDLYLLSFQFMIYYKKFWLIGIVCDGLIQFVGQLKVEI